MKLSIAICDDQNTDSEYIETIVRAWAASRGHTAVCHRFPSAESFLFETENAAEFEILLLDIEMKEMSGVTLATRIRKQNSTVQIIFITGYSDYIAEGYEVAALHYLMKPVKTEKLMTVLDRAVEKCVQNERYLTLFTADATVRIPLHEIRFLDVYKNYVTIHAGEAHTVKKSLGDMEKELDERFFRAGRALIVNLGYIKKVTKTEVHLSDGTVLPLPRGAYDALNRAIIQGS